MKIQRFVLSSAVALAAFGVGVGLIELGNYTREVYVSPKLGARVETLPPQFAMPVIVGPVTEFDPPRIESKIEPAQEHEWSGTGEYYIVGKKPKGFENFDWLLIITREWDDKPADKPRGWLHTLEKNEDGRKYEFSAININGNRVAIVTRAVKGVSYQFDGKFVDEKLTLKSEYGYEYEAEIVLKGRLTKWQRGKKIAEAKVKFEKGGC